MRLLISALKVLHMILKEIQVQEKRPLLESWQKG